MNILIVSDSYPPEIRSASHLMQELAEELRDRNHRVTVATCYPKYNLAAGAQTLFAPVSVENGIRVIRIHSLPHHKVNFILRGISQLTLPDLFNARIRRCLKDEAFGAVIVYSPPLPLWRVGLQMKARGSRFILNVQDIFPQNAIDLKALRNPLLIRYFQRMEVLAYRAADIVTVHSEGNREHLLRAKSVTPEKLRVLHNWVDMDAAQRIPGDGRFRKLWGLGNKFLFFFGGVMGPAQGLDIVIEAAQHLRDEKDIAVLLVGDGTERDRLQRLAGDYGLDRVIFKPFIDKADYRDLLAEVDVGLVCLKDSNRTPVVPGKILGYMAAGLPVLALLNRESDGHHVIRQSGCGCSDISNDAGRAARLMLDMYEGRDRLKDSGAKGYAFAATHYSRKVCVDGLEAMCLQSVGTLRSSISSPEKGATEWTITRREWS